MRADGVADILEKIVFAQVHPVASLRSSANSATMPYKFSDWGFIKGVTITLSGTIRQWRNSPQYGFDTCIGAPFRRFRRPFREILRASIKQ